MRSFPAALGCCPGERWDAAIRLDTALAALTPPEPRTSAGDQAQEGIGWRPTRPTSSQPSMGCTARSGADGLREVEMAGRLHLTLAEYRSLEAGGRYRQGERGTTHLEATCGLPLPCWCTEPTNPNELHHVARTRHRRSRVDSSPRTGASTSPHRASRGSCSDALAGRISGVAR